MLPKRIRIVDEELLETVRSLPCMGCGQTPSHPHHLTSRGAGGGDIPTNVIPLCPVHHAEFHQQPGKTIRKYPSIRYWLEAAERYDVLARHGISHSK